MRLGIMQPYFFPYIGYWQLMNAVDKYVIYEDVNYINRGWINRNQILINGKGKMINLQLHNASQNKLINEVEVFNETIHREKLLKTLESCYKKAPYYSKAFHIIKDIILQDEKNLAKYLEYSIRKISEYLCMDTEIVVSSTLNKDNSLRGQQKIVEICKILSADEYINAIGGKDLYSYEVFEDNGMMLRFLHTDSIAYKQFHKAFVPNLSIIDVMMFNSQEEIIQMLEECKLF